MDSILNFQEKYIESDAIKSYEFNEYQPTSGSNLSSPGTINIHIENQNEFYHPGRSYLLVEGNLLKEGGTRYAAANVIALTNNGVMHLFSNVKYEVAGQEIESVNNPEITGVLMGIAKFPYDYANGAGMIQFWSPETSDGVLGERAFARRKEYIIENPIPTVHSVLQSSWRTCLVSAKIMTRWCMVCVISSPSFGKVLMMLSKRLPLLIKAKLN